MIRVFGLNAYEEEINEIRKKYVEYFGLRYGWKANKNLPFDQGHWNRPVIKKSKYFPFDMSEHPSFYLGHRDIAKIWDAINNELGGGRALVRAYVNGYTYGTDGYLHSDDAYTFQKYGDEGISETVIVYLNPIWDPNWAGETVLFDENKEIAKAVLPKPNRAFVFDSHLIHAGRAVSRACTELRSVLVYKTAKKELYDDPAVKFLLENTLIQHDSPSGSLFGHLWNVMRLLEINSFDEPTAAAGLFHSIYGNQHFETQTVEDRDVVKGLIGDEAEAIVYEFNQLKDRFTQVALNTNKYDDSMRNSLLALCWANTLEQGGDPTRWHKYLPETINLADQKFQIL
jgi:hypothetical protein